MRAGRGSIAVLLLLALVVNLPLVHQAWQHRQLDRDGRDVAATVTDTQVLRPDSADPVHVVRFRLPEDVDPSGQTWPAEVDRATYDRAELSKQIEVRVQPGKPGNQQVAGATSSSLGYVVIGIVDAIVLALGLLLWAHRRRRDADRDPDGADGGPATLAG
ncbi:DUF3592 domain-containing protein [Pimelobacter simplex]|uniref:DUF3592 domain-containing protein n=1 Tax=Nocardioides simplex TaxID=2045 RepID=UPI003AAE75E3